MRGRTKGTWKCPMCKSWNFPNAVNCENCLSPKPEPKIDATPEALVQTEQPIIQKNEG